MHEIPNFIYTPASQKVMFNLLTAISSNLGGLINGDFGIGKTQTITALCHYLAKKQIKWSLRGGGSYICLGNILSAMAIGGFWLCLDEIN